jgi:hypothetical protein
MEDYSVSSSRQPTIRALRVYLVVGKRRHRAGQDDLLSEKAEPAPRTGPEPRFGWIGPKRERDHPAAQSSPRPASEAGLSALSFPCLLLLFDRNRA